MKTEYPDYSNSIVNLACSVLKYYGIKDIKHPTLSDVDAVLEKIKPRNVVIMLFDAMGISIIDRHLPKDSFLRSKIVRSITSTFPPTTVAATTAINSGLTPLETGWLGWITYFKEVDQNVVTFFNTVQNTKTPASDRHLAYTTLPYKTVSMQIREANPQTKVTAMAPFPVNVTDPTVITKSIADACERVLDVTNEPGSHYIYCYWDNPDYSMHEYGVDDTEHITPILQDIDSNLRRLSQSISDDTVVIVTADHSQINSKWVFLSDYPDLKDLLVRNHSMETRAASLVVKEGKKEEFRKLFEKYLGKHFILMDHDQFLSSGLLGTGVPHPRTESFVGDFVAIATDEYCIEDYRTDDVLKGIHAGLTAEEMDVPLIIL